MAFEETQARQALEKIIADYRALLSDERSQMSEASVVRQFVDRLLDEVLGWPIRDPQRYKYELSTQAGRPDLTLFPESGGTIFIEAKRFGVIKDLKQVKTTLAGTVTPGQMALPGMATDRTPEEQQAINYAFSNGGTWAILTNFEKLRLFNARRDWMVLSFEEPSAYLQDFDLLWQLSYRNVLNGSLDVLSNQRLRENVDSNYLAFINEWRERLAQDIVSNPNKNPWAFDSEGHVDLGLLRAVVQRFLDRLVVIRFAEDHLVIPPGTLHELYELKQRSIYTFSMDEFLDRFFRQFDENHNSALFAEDVTDEAVLSDEVLLPLVGKLYEARYRSMPADIIGNTYEQYLGKTLVSENGSVTTRDNLETRKKQGSYYTPQVIVRYIVDNSLGRYLYGTTNGKPDGEPVDGVGRKTTQDIRDLRVLDSACGSGSFLIYAYYVLADFYESELTRIEQEAENRRQELVADGMVSPLELQIQLTPYTAELDRIRDYPRLILETHLYGVDLDPQAAEIAVVNLMMRAMERRHRQKRLPLILNQNVKVGNSLIGLRPDDPRMVEHAEELANIQRLRLAQVSTPNGAEHEQIIADLGVAVETLNKALGTDFEEHFSDSERVRPFHWGVEFPEVFYDEDGQLLENPGFTITFGNPPWEIVKPDLREFYAQFDSQIESRLNRRQVEARITELNTEDLRREREWEAQKERIEQSAAYFRATTDYVQQGRGDTATHKLFVERMYGLLAGEGRLGYVVPSGIYTDLGTKQLREMLLDEGHIQYIFSFSNERFFFPGVHHSFKFALLGVQKGVQAEGFWAAFRFNPRVAVAPDDLPEFLEDESNLVYMRRDSLERFSPDSLSLMEFQSQQDVNIIEKMYSDSPLLGEAYEDAWNVRLNNEFHMTNDRHLFNTKSGIIAVYNGRMIHQFDAAYAPHEFWIAEDKVAELSPNTAEQIRQYRLGYRRIALPTNIRTLIGAIVPPSTICDTVAVVENSQSLSTIVTYLSGLFNSLCLDYVLRQKIATTVNMFYVYQLPVPRLTADNPYFDAIVPRAARLTCTRPEFADLWEDVMGEAWGDSIGAVDPEERQQLRDEIDAIVAHLYGLTRDEFDHVLGTFPLVFPDDEAGRLKRNALLAVYDEWVDRCSQWEI